MNQIKEIQQLAKEKLSGREILTIDESRMCSTLVHMGPNIAKRLLEAEHGADKDSMWSEGPLDSLEDVDSLLSEGEFVLIMLFLT